MTSDPALPQTQPCGLNDPEQENSFRFTPIKALRALPRLWERKPSTPFRAEPRQKSKKLWKRIQGPFSSMKTLQQTGRGENDAFQTAINTSRDAAYVRGVKRLCVGSGETEDRVERREPGRSFLETKWESDVSRKRRKLPDAPFNIYDENALKQGKDAASQPAGSGHEAGENDVNIGLDDAKRELMSTGSFRPIDSLRSSTKMEETQDAMHINSLLSPVSGAKLGENCESWPTNQEQCARTNNADESNSTTTAVQGLTHEQEGKLVRSALRSSLDGEDAELLNDFLSRAMAKRAAKAALTISGIEQSLSPEVSPEEGSTPRSRQVLKNVDTGSPSPMKVQVSTSKSESIPADDAQDDVSKDIQDDEPAPASPACRRSTRVKVPPADAPAARNTISLRRAKGNEFIFLQRTEAQELALATKRNTRKNRGNSVFPKYALQVMSEQGSENPIDKPEQLDYHGASNCRSAAQQKHVSWDEERLVEYEDESLTPEEAGIGEDANKKSDVDNLFNTRSGAKRPEKKAAVSSSTRSSRSQILQKGAEPESGPSTSAFSTSTTTASPRPRRVRRLGDSTTGVSGTPVKTGSGRISKPPAPGPMVAAASAGPSTPTKSRRKLTPKSPSSSLLPAPSSKNEQSFVSGIPTRSAAAGSSEGTKRKSMIQGSAGCTPMPRRVRART